MNLTRLTSKLATECLLLLFRALLCEVRSLVVRQLSRKPTLLIMAITALSWVTLVRSRLVLLWKANALVIGNGLETLADLTSKQLN